MEIEIQDFTSNSLSETLRRTWDTNILQLLDMTEEELSYSVERLFTLAHIKGSWKIIWWVACKYRPALDRRIEPDFYIDSIRVSGDLKGNGIWRQLVEDVFRRIKERVDTVSMSIEPEDEEKRERWGSFLRREAIKTKLKLKECWY